MEQDRSQGISSQAGGAQTVAIYIDGVYVANPVAGLGSFLDLDRVEVLMGPQAVLYGRNATAGAIQLISKRPSLTDIEGEVSGQLASYGGRMMRGAISAPLVKDVLGLRISATASRHDGFTKNLYSGIAPTLIGTDLAYDVKPGSTVDPSKNEAVRASLLFEPSSAVSVLLRATYQNEKRGFALRSLETDQNDNFGAPGGLYYTQTALPAAGYLTPASFSRCEDPQSGANTWYSESDPFTTCTISPSFTKRKYFLASGEASVDLGFAKLTSVTGFTSIKNGESYIGNGDSAVPFIATLGEKGGLDRAFSQEAYLSGETGPVEWLLGAYFFDQYERQSTLRGLLFGRPNLGVPGREPVNRTRSTAGYAELNFKLTHWMSLRAGGRYTEDRIHATFFTNTGSRQDVRVPESDFSPKVSIEIKPDQIDGLFYAKIEKGYKSGGVNTNNLIPYSSEQLWNYEAGFKTNWLGGLLQLNGNAFYYDYSDLQVSTSAVNPVTGVTQAFVQNAASATVRGFTLDLGFRPIAGLTINANWTHLDPKFGKGVCLYNPNAFVTAAGLPSRPWQYRDNNNASFLCPNAAGSYQAIPVGFGYRAAVMDVGGNPLPRAPRNQLNMVASYALDVGSGKLKLNANGIFTSRIRHTAYNTFLGVYGTGTVWKQRAETAPNLMFDASVGYELANWSARLFVNNLTNRTVISHMNTPFTVGPQAVYAPPRVLGVEVGFKF